MIMDFLKKAWRAWLRIAKPIGNFQSQVILSVFYIIILLPLGIYFRITDPLRIKSKVKRSNFSPWNHLKEKLEDARRQY
jgi:hypothetical protein